jgi:flagellin-like protein
MNKKGLSPLIATILLVVFALIIGTATMSWGKNYVSSVPDEPSQFASSFVISIEQIDDPLKELQIRYITDKINRSEYLVREQQVLSELS